MPIFKSGQAAYQGDILRKVLDYADISSNNAYIAGRAYSREYDDEAST